MDTLLVDRCDSVVTVTLNQPAKKNAATSETWRQLAAVVAQVAASADDRVLVIAGAGGDFCSGADVSGLAAGNADPPLVAMRALADTALALHRLPKPTVAKVAGVAAGAGCNLALSCDLIVAADTARFSAIFVRRR